jgi:hypothetical protein
MSNLDAYLAIGTVAAMVPGYVILAKTVADGLSEYVGGLGALALMKAGADTRTPGSHYRPMCHDAIQDMKIDPLAGMLFGLIQGGRKQLFAARPSLTERMERRKLEKATR